MALPKKIAPYSYRDQEHQNRVNWRVDPARAALLVHDMQRYFVRAFELERDGQTLPDAQINIAIANIRRLVDAAHAANIPVYYTAQHEIESRREYEAHAVHLRRRRKINMGSQHLSRHPAGQHAQPHRQNHQQTFAAPDNHPYRFL